MPPPSVAMTSSIDPASWTDAGAIILSNPPGYSLVSLFYCLLCEDRPNARDARDGNIISIEGIPIPQTPQHRHCPYAEASATESNRQQSTKMKHDGKLNITSPWELPGENVPANPQPQITYGLSHILNFDQK